MKEKKDKKIKSEEEILVQKKISEIDKNLKEDSSDRKKMMEEVNSSFESYIFKALEYEKKIKEYELMEIKYHNLERELKEKTDIYETKISNLESDNEKLKKENFDFKKEVINNESKITALKTIIDLVINDYGMDYIIEASGLTLEKIKEYLQD